MRRVLLALAGLAVGLGLGLLYTWVISPVEYTDTSPDALRADYQAGYITLAARAYAVDHDLGRARTRLAMLGLPDPAQGVAALAQRTAADTGADSAHVRVLADLAAALSGTLPTPAPSDLASATPPGGSPGTAGSPTGAASAGTPPASASPSGTPRPPATATRTPRPTDTVIPSITPRLLPTRTPTATPLSAFNFVGRQLVCDPALGQPLIQVVAESAAGEQIPGVEVVIIWDGGFDHFYTGLKPDLGRGYGDFTMTEGIEYTLNLAESPSLVIEGLSAETCTTPQGSSFLGSWLLVFRQPGR